MSQPRSFSLNRSIPIQTPVDVVVAGGGPAGSAAAITAARLGVKVLLVEGTGALGGMGTNALVSYWYCMANNKEAVAGGLVPELCQDLYDRQYTDPSRGPEYWQKLKRGIGFNAEGLKLLLDEYCADADVEVRFCTSVIDVDADPEAGHVRGVILHNVEGYCYVPTTAVIDATGDAKVCHMAGAESERAGQDTANIMPPTLCASIVNIDFDRFDRSLQQPLVDQAVAEGYFSQPDRHVPGLFRNGENTAILNAGHIFDMDALDCRSLSDGYAQGRRFVEEYVRFFRDYVPGCERAEAVGTGALMGVRESRHIVGEYCLNREDFMSRRHFPDQIGIYFKQVDVHVYAPTDAEYERVFRDFDDVAKPADGESYGMLVPRGWSNLWAAGRCASSDVFVNGAIRDQPGCLIMGQAAATATVQHIHSGQPACRLNTATLVDSLRAQGAILPQGELSPEMTRSAGMAMA
jgi:hypothetical protein